MKKYRISISGRGADCYIHYLTEEQNEALTEGGADEDDMSMDEILEVLGKDYVTDGDGVVLGAYEEPGNYMVSVYDENDQLVWESDDKMDLPVEPEDSVITYDEETALICEDILKGEFYNYELEIDEDFDPSKLSAVVEHVGDVVSLITGLKYDGEQLEMSDVGDYSDSGFNFYLVG